jgi:hypothetical protein
MMCSKTATIYYSNRNLLVKGDKYWHKTIRSSIPWDSCSKFYEMAGEVRLLENVPTEYYSIMVPQRMQRFGMLLIRLWEIIVLKSKRGEMRTKSQGLRSRWYVLLNLIYLAGSSQVILRDISSIRSISISSLISSSSKIIPFNCFTVCLGDGVASELSEQFQLPLPLPVASQSWISHPKVELKLVVAHIGSWGWRCFPRQMWGEQANCGSQASVMLAW